jgi:integrase
MDKVTTEIEGMEYLLSRESSEAPWYIHLPAAGKMGTKCLQTNDTDLALRNARKVIAAAPGDPPAAVRKTPRPEKPEAGKIQPTNPTVYFQFEGKEYRLFKRENSVDAPWYIKLQVDGKIVKKSLETNVQEVAEDHARRVIAALKGNKWDAIHEPVPDRKEARQTPEPTLPTAYFKFEGKEYRLYKRENSVDAAWYIKIQVDGKILKKSLETNLRDVAERNARLVVTTAKRGQWNLLQKPKEEKQAPHATIGEVLAIYRTNPEGISSWKQMENSLLRACRVVYPDKASRVESLSTEVLNKTFLSHFRGAVAGGGESDDRDALQLKRVKISANSTLRMARAVFSRRMLDHYEAQGLRLPPLDGFLKGPGFTKVTISYVRPNAELIARTFKLVDKLWTVRPGKIAARRREMFTVFVLACGAGMRKSEIGQAKWSWFNTHQDGTVWVQSFVSRSDHALGKDGNVVDAPVVMDWWPRIKMVREWTEANEPRREFILPGSETYRTETVFRNANGWLRRLGWESQKGIHEFRAYVGSKVAEKFGMRLASLFCRHKDETITRKYYGRYVELKAVRLSLAD